MQLDRIDKQILGLIQTNFPVVSRPYRLIAEKLGLEEAEVINRIHKLRQAGIIRRLGGLFDSRKVGYVGTLCAMKVPSQDIERVGGVIAEYPGITHNYLRDHEYNMWFTLLAESEQKIESILNDILSRTGITQVLNLPSQKVFKVRVKFDL
ncbi:transcriptional regulator, AsnC family [Desulfotomaculum arcticum]|uniref:siroheme decarboxylase n=1 Tax=Desulfotruncus arcticus DSM 17038 TaxID=1121424 RepID=A0A1I2NJP1_9FIRM|nr:AsnC family transcriptional regulator [Desulfotruncus arcticus]SFG01907.1 transcriptional regulator, AsnC family [Desulfotomaculum arcticum] [Desulfotruncus arcticus DSM 17038]